MRWCRVLLASLLATAVARAAEPTGLTPDAAVAFAVEASVAVAAARGRLAAAEGRLAQAAFLMENPGFNTQLGVVGPRLFQFQFAQPVSVSGEGIRARAAARAEVSSVEAEIERRRFEAAAAARRSWAEVAAARQRAEIARQAADLSIHLAEAAALRLEAGEAPVLDLRLALLAKARADAELLRALQDEADALATLSTLIGRPLTLGDVAGDPLSAAPTPTGSVEEVRSDVISAREALTSAEASLARARAAVVPRLGIGFYAQNDESGPLIGPNLEWRIPSFDRNQAGRGEARGAVVAATATANATEVRAEVEQRTARARVVVGEEALAPVGDLGAEARAALESIEDGRASGELDLATALLLRNQVLDGMVALVDLRRAVAIARIDLLLATEDPALIP